MVKKRCYTEESLSLAWDRVEVFYGEFFCARFEREKNFVTEGYHRKM